MCIEVAPIGMGVFDPQNDNVYNVVEPDTCININIIDDTEPIILTDVVSDQNDENENVYCKMNSLKCCCIIIILFIIGIILL